MDTDTETEVDDDGNWTTTPQMICDVFSLLNPAQIQQRGFKFFHRAMNWDTEKLEDIERNYYKPFCLTLKTNSTTMTSFIFAGYDALNFQESWQIYKSENCAACGRCGSCPKCQLCCALSQDCGCLLQNKYAKLSRYVDHKGTYINVTEQCHGGFNQGIVGLQGTYLPGDDNPVIYLFGGFGKQQNLNDIYLYNYVSNQMSATVAFTHAQSPLLSVTIKQPSSLRKLRLLVAGFIKKNHCEFEYAKNATIYFIVAFLGQDIFYFECVEMDNLNKSQISLSVLQNNTVGVGKYNQWTCPQYYCCSGLVNSCLARYCRGCSYERPRALRL